MFTDMNGGRALGAGGLLHTRETFQSVAFFF